MVLTENVNEFRDGRNGDETKPGEQDAGTGMCGGGHWVYGETVVIVCCPPEADTVENAVSKFFVEERH